MRRSGTALALVAILVGLLGLSGCAEPTSPTGQADGQPGGGVLTIGRPQDSTTFDPIKTVQNSDLWVIAVTAEGLVRADRSGTTLEPGLAESWTVSDDGLTYRFTMRDAKFSDGSPITAADAAFTLLRLRNDPESVWKDGYQVISTADAPDARTLVVTLTTPSAPFLATLAMPGASIVSKAGLEAMGAEAYAEHPLASGPFVLRQRIPDRVILDRNPNYWQADRVRLAGVEWVTVPDDNTRVLKVQAGELDAAIAVPFSRVPELRQDANLDVHLDPSTSETHLLINNEHGALARKEVRQALDMAIDKQAIVDVVTGGIGQVANSYIPAGALYHDPDIRPRPHDPEAAKAMLAAAGASGLTLEYVVNAGAEVEEQIAVLVQQQLAQVGVTAVPKRVDQGQFWTELGEGNFDITVSSWTNDTVDADQKTTFALGHDINMSYMTRYKNDAVRDLVAAARVERDPGKRKAIYVDLQKDAAEEVPFVNLFCSPYVTVSRKTVQNLFQNPLGRFFLEETVKN